MKLEIYECDKCGDDCSTYENRVIVHFPFGEQQDLCMKCARKLFPEQKESEVTNAKE
jgi:hypothetical protein